MATSRKLPNVKDLSGYFFIAIQGTNVSKTYHDDTKEGYALGVAFTNALREDDKLYDIVSVAILSAIEDRSKKEKYSSKKSNKLLKKPVKTAKKK